MSQRRSPPSLAYPCALALAIAIVSLLSLLANPIPANWDALYYIDMAESGLRDNPHLTAPFAYRPAMPMLARFVASALSLPLASGFAIVGWISGVAFLMAVFVLARSFTRRLGHALLPMVLLGSYFTHVKIALHFYAFVDVAAYPLMVLAFWALVQRRIGLCIAISCVGLLFKEFLAIPLLLAVVQLGLRAVRQRSARNVAFFTLAAALGVTAIVLPRVLIPVSTTAQFVDPINDPTTLRRLLDAPLDELRNFNIVYALVGCWLPTLVLMTRKRFDRLWSDLDEADALWPVLGTIALVLLLTMYGGTNVTVFVGYMVGAQALVLALLLRRGVGRLEAAWAVVATVAYNKLLLSIPSPDADFGAYIDFYGGWSSRVTMSSVTRLVECAAFVAVGAVLRGVVARLPERRAAAAAAAAASERHA
jgi:hypothetical protein